MSGNLTKARTGVISVSSVIFPEVAQRKAVQVPAVCGIAKRAEIGVVWSDNNGTPTGREQTMKLLHRSNHIGHMLDDMNRAYLAKGAVAKREWKLIQIGNHIRARMSIAINPDAAGIFVDPAADIENRKFSRSRALRDAGLGRDAYCSRDRKHCSSVSIAKSA